MGLNDRDWYREDIREREKRNQQKAGHVSEEKVNNEASVSKSNRTKKYEKLVFLGLVMYVLLVYVLKNLIDFPGCAAVITMNILVFVLIKMGKLDKEALGCSYYNVIKCKEEYRIFTGAFTHFEPIHLLCNLAALYDIGPYMERILGTTRFIVVYALINILGGYISAALHRKKPYTASIGASGVICGILGIYLTIAFSYMGFAGITSMIPTILILLLMTFSPKIDSIGHFTGMAVGIMCGVVLLYIV